MNSGYLDRSELLEIKDIEIDLIQARIQKKLQEYGILVGNKEQNLKLLEEACIQESILHQEANDDSQSKQKDEHLQDDNKNIQKPEDMKIKISTSFLDPEKPDFRASGPLPTQPLDIPNTEIMYKEHRSAVSRFSNEVELIKLEISRLIDRRKDDVTSLNNKLIKANNERKKLVSKNLILSEHLQNIELKVEEYCLETQKIKKRGKELVEENKSLKMELENKQNEYSIFHEERMCELKEEIKKLKEIDEESMVCLKRFKEDQDLLIEENDALKVLNQNLSEENLHLKRTLEQANLHERYPLNEYALGCKKDSDMQMKDAHVERKMYIAEKGKADKLEMKSKLDENEKQQLRVELKCLETRNEEMKMKIEKLEENRNMSADLQERKLGFLDIFT